MTIIINITVKINIFYMSLLLVQLESLFLCIIQVGTVTFLKYFFPFCHILWHVLLSYILWHVLLKPFPTMQYLLQCPGTVTHRMLDETRRREKWQLWILNFSVRAGLSGRPVTFSPLVLHCLHSIPGQRWYKSTYNQV